MPRLCTGGKETVILGNQTIIQKQFPSMYFLRFSPIVAFIHIQFFGFLFINIISFIAPLINSSFLIFSLFFLYFIFLPSYSFTFFLTLAYTSVSSFSACMHACVCIEEHSRAQVQASVCLANQSRRSSSLLLPPPSPAQCCHCRSRNTHSLFFSSSSLTHTFTFFRHHNCLIHSFPHSPLNFLSLQSVCLSSNYLTFSHYTHTQPYALSSTLQFPFIQSELLFSSFSRSLLIHSIYSFIIYLSIVSLCNYQAVRAICHLIVVVRVYITTYIHLLSFAPIFTTGLLVAIGLTFVTRSAIVDKSRSNHTNYIRSFSLIDANQFQIDLGHLSSHYCSTSTSIIVDNFLARSTSKQASIILIAFDSSLSTRTTICTDSR